nr:hypothetical protein Hi04_10k_c5591_00004 [uncultured bacterium]
MTRPGLRLRNDVRLGINYEDTTRFGSVVGGGIERQLAKACENIGRHRARHGMADVVARARSLLTEAFAGELGALFRAPGSLHEECLFPPREAVRPQELTVTRADGAGHALGLPTAAFRELAPWLAEFSRGAERPLAPLGRVLFDALEAAGALAPGVEAPTALPAHDAVFVGHASVLVARGGARLLFDPLLLPRSPRYPAHYQPLRAAELSPEAVFVTHSHPDHFDVGSLLRLGHDTPIFVPDVERESLLATDMAYRLEELGFSRVVRLRPGARTAIGRTSVLALPFYGEQPTTGDVLHPEVRNSGLIYTVEAPGLRLALLADAGRDRDGDTMTELASARRALGDFRAVFGGYRAFAVYPIHYLFSSVARYLLFVPERDWALRQKTMHDADDLVEVAERAGALEVVPYADGGAPWHWERGLGPRLDGGSAEHHAVDPPPEEVSNRAAARSSSLEGPIASPVEVILLRPGQALTFCEHGVEFHFGPEQRWPFDDGTWLQCNVALGRSENLAADSARALFDALRPELETWRRDGALSCFFFMRKPPDLRLRFCATRSLKPVLLPLLERLQAQGHVEHAYFSPYVPEVERFGGRVAMRAVHTWFDADTRAWLALEQLRRRALAVLTSEQFCAHVASDLAENLLGHAEDQVDFWRNLAGRSDPASLEAAPQTSGGDAANGDGGVEERALLLRYSDEDRALVATLVELARRDELLRPPRSILQSVIRFHWHRHGIDGSSQARLALGLAAASSRGREIGGVTPE